MKVARKISVFNDFWRMEAKFHWNGICCTFVFEGDEK
jgi:hypothetical protein